MSGAATLRAPATGAAARRRRSFAPLLLSLPALAVVGTLIIVPLAMTAMLSLHSFGMYTGVTDDVSLANYIEIFGDPYFHDIFLRTLRISAFVTLLAMLMGAPEAYILHRMRAPWRSLFLLVMLGPLLISVVARTLHDPSVELVHRRPGTDGFVDAEGAHLIRHAGAGVGEVVGDLLEDGGVQAHAVTPAVPRPGGYTRR